MLFAYWLEHCLEVFGRAGSPSSRSHLSSWSQNGLRRRVPHIPQEENIHSRTTRTPQAKVTSRAAEKPIKTMTTITMGQEPGPSSKTQEPNTNNRNNNRQPRGQSTKFSVTPRCRATSFGKTVQKSAKSVEPARGLTFKAYKPVP